MSVTISSNQSKQWIIFVLTSTTIVAASMGYLLGHYHHHYHHYYNQKKKKDRIDDNDNVFENDDNIDINDDKQPVAYAALVGHTPMVKLHKLSALLQCNVIVKMENMNPGGTGKDRLANALLSYVKTHPNYRPGIAIVEGTSGSTGIALACQCRALGLPLHVVMPDDQASEKKLLLEKLGAKVMIVPTCSIANGNHYVNTARKLAKELNGIFLDQFENVANYQIHFETTGPEIWKQTKGRLHAFVMSSGTGGTIAGVSRYLKSKNPGIKVILADPEGSSLLNRVTHGVCFAPQQKERSVRKHRYDSIVEGVGLDRITKNFDKAQIDDAIRASDQEVLNMAHWLLINEGLFVGSSSALNVAATYKLAKRLGPGHTLVTVICDSGHRHLSRLWNPDFIATSASEGLYGKLSWPSSNPTLPSDQ